MSGRAPTRPSRGTVLGLSVGLLLVVLVRVLVPYDAVFRDGAVVMVGNDPYRFRFWIEQLLASGLNPFDPWDLARLPDDVRGNDVMFIWAMWLAAEVVGGDVRAGGLVLAWYPVVSALLTAGLVYGLATLLAGDRRVAVLSVVLLALTPAHAYRTMLGFGDHHAFDYVALTLTATALVWLISMEHRHDGRPWRRPAWWIGVALLGGAVATQSLAWRGGPILLLPIGVYAVVATVSAVRARQSPLVNNSGLLAGLVVASGLSALVHLGPNWAPAYRGFAPLFLLGLVVGLLVVGELAVRTGLSWVEVALVTPVVVIGWVGVSWFGIPPLRAGFDGFVAFLERTSRQRTMGIGEVASLVGSIETPLLLFGFLLLVAVPAMIWILGELVREHRPGWIAVSAYAWVFLALSVNRVRFSGQLAVFVAVFAAVGLVWLAARMEHASPLSLFAVRRSAVADGWRTPERHDPLRVAAALALLVVLVAGIGVAQLPETMDRVTVEDSEYEAAQRMAAYADERGWAYPRSYVFSEWGRNLLYNYEVSGQSRGYGYAQRNYRPFVSSSDPEGWYEELEGRAGFVVVRSSRFAYPADSMQVRLDERYGGAGEGVPGLAHYRLVYASEDGSLKAFALVPGATIAGTAAPNASVTVETEVQVGSLRFTYRRVVRTGSNGEYAVTVPYPGRYRVGSDDVVVTEANVADGDTLGR